MRCKLSSLLTILLIVGSNDARPSKPGSPEVGKENGENAAAAATASKGIADESSSKRPNEPRSSSVVKSDSRNELKSLDQSLRTVATQLLNVTNPNESKQSTHDPNTSNEKMSNVLLIHKSNDKTSQVPPSRFASGGLTSSTDKSLVALVNDVNNSDKSFIGSIAVGFGRPVNSKFGFFESSHPGVAMALTEEELERELSSSSSTRLITAHKNHPTTPGGISTWVLMQSPTTAATTTTTTTTTNEPSSKTETKTTSSLNRISMAQSTIPMERITTLSKSTTPSVKKTTARPITTTETLLNSEKSGQATLIPTESTVSSTTPKTTITTRKSTTAAAADTSRLTMRPKLTSPKPTDAASKPTTTKIARPSSVQSIKPKLTPTRKPAATKSPVETTKHPSTSKIEKVTFRPVTMITIPKPNDIQKHGVVEKPIFLTKLKTSIVNANPIEASIATKNNVTIVTKQSESKFPDPENSPVVPTKIKKPNKTSNVLKVQLKKPTESPTNIEIEAIKVNAPVLRIEKIEPKRQELTNKVVSSKRNMTKTAAPAVALIPENSRIDDVQFNFNPEIKQVDETAETLSVTESIVTTTKRPQHKRKKNKLRRRRPASSTTPSPATTSLGTTAATILTDSPNVAAASTERSDLPTELGIIDNAIQESKIAPESKVSGGDGAGTTALKTNKKKQVQKPIGTQIYNFLSREVMPSFGVMSLVGLGLGLASYFLYPFGGAIARRNYVVEPNYKYNMEEYGGGANYGQSEEEVFSKVLQGMTNNDGKYGGIKDYETNFYRYQQQQPTTRRIPEALKYTTDPAAGAVYRPIATTNYASSEKYRNTDFNKYPAQLSATTSDYYDRQKKPDFVGKKSADRQFVVGNIPKEYNYDNRANLAATLPIAITDTATIPVESHRENYKFPVDPHAEALKSSADYDDQEIEITPGAVQVEHGPRSLNLDPPKLQRKKRDSVIQLIPSRTEIEKEEKEIQTEEPLSNEILDIIDSVIPPNGPSANDPTRQITNVKASADDKNKVGLDSEQASVIAENNTQKMSVGSKKIAIRIEATRKTNLAVEQNEKETIAASTEETTKEMLFDFDSTTPSSISSTVPSLSIDEILGTSGDKTDGTNSQDSDVEGGGASGGESTKKPTEERFNIFSFVKKIAEVKLRLGVAILKHASEGFARYLGHVQKRINGEEQ